MNDKRQQIETRMKEITTFIEQATDTVRAGKMVTLHHLDDEVAALCESAVALPPEEAGHLQAPMGEMIGKLEALATALQDYREKVRNKS